MGLKMLTVRGETKPLIQWAKEAGLGYKVVYSRIYGRGWSPEKALSTPVISCKVHELTVKGETHSLAEWGRRLGIDGGSIKERLRAGYTPEEAVTIPPHAKPRGELLTIDGKTQSISQWAAESGMKYRTLKDRLDSGMDPKEAMATKAEGKKKRYCAYLRATDELIALDATLLELSKITGLTELTLQSYVSLQNKGKRKTKYIIIPSDFSDFEGGEENEN